MSARSTSARCKRPSREPVSRFGTRNAALTSDHSHHLQRLAKRLPGPVRSALAWVLRPEAKWLRSPLGLVLILSGLLGFLPILGFWMVPLGALLLAEDFPLVRKPTVRAIDAVESWWTGRHRIKGERESHDSVHP